MKLHELRIGNIVIGDTGGIYKWELSDFADWYNDHNSHEYGSHVRPLPLTEEWLEKLGFNKYPNQKKYDRDDFWSCEQRCKNEWWFCDLEASVKHVHQLQNLYHSLTGSELACNLAEH